jgi:hypothetical protein
MPNDVHNVSRTLTKNGVLVSTIKIKQFYETAIIVGHYCEIVGRADDLKSAMRTHKETVDENGGVSWWGLL